VGRVDPALLEVGRIEKPHGLRGQVVVRLLTNRAERLTPGTELTTPDGTLLVKAASPHQDRWLVTFAGVDSREAADALRGTILSAPPIDDPDELWVHDLIGAEVVDHGIVRGRVVEVEANPASDLLVLDTGALVPVRFVVRVEAGERVEVDAPDGLFDPA
jgi:16S rRNA processing protein RimM